jgi:hypothetical protein
MSDIFGSQPGSVFKAPGPIETGVIEVEGLTDVYRGVVIINSIGFSQNVRIQYKPTIGGAIYVYPLGDNMGRVMLSGMAFENLCSNGSPNGFAKLMEFFKKKRASTEEGIDNPVSIRITGFGPKITGFLHAINVSMRANETNAWWEWQMELGAIPQFRSGN